jgi:hypothetical protein
MSKVKVKKKKAEKVVDDSRPVATEATTAKAKEFVFVSRDKSKEMKMASPMEKNKASEVLFDVLNRGPIPEGLKLQWADSYSGHFINKRGKNACGASDRKDLLVINGIASELEAAGVKSIIQPESKPYKAIRLGGMSKEEIKDLTAKIAMILGFTRTKKSEAKEGIPSEA